MKTLITALIFILFSKFSFPQFTFNTFYYVAPTVGCNGIWAIDISTFIDSNCAQPFLYLENPCHDVLNANISGDTLFLPLCSLPCYFQMVSSDGICTGDCNL